MKKWLSSLLILFILIPSIFVFAQDSPSPSLEITGANASELPTITITTNVLDSNNLPVEGLTIDDFSLGGDLEGIATIVRVENITSDDLPFATVLVIDSSISMSGTPLLRAKEAATLFVQSIGENDPVALVTFGNTVRLVQDYTTDTAQLLDAINGLQVSGNTALYDAAVFAVETAADAPVPRRAVVLLSDGAEFGGASRNGRGTGLDEATQNGVSVYTIGLGFGTDRSFLQELAIGTNARNYESPTPGELASIYAELAGLFRTQYVVTIESDIPADGTSYEFTLQANTASGETNVDTGTIRAPIPVPIVDLDDSLFGVAFSSPVTITPDVRADDEITDLTVTIDGEAVELVDGSLIIDPIAYPPGSYDLEVTATDIDGDSGSDSVIFETAALASEVTVDFASGTEISETTTITIAADGQTPASTVTYSVLDSDGASVQSESSSDTENSFPFTIDPFTLEAGDYDLFIGVENEGGATANVTVPFSIATLAPRNIIVEGIEADSDVEEATTITVSADAQAGATILETTVTIAGETEPLEDLTLRPAALQPGPLDLDITVSDSNGQTVTETVTVRIASLPPQITFGDLPQPVTGDSSVEVLIDSQTPLLSVIYNFSDGIDISLQAHSDGTYPPIPLNIMLFSEGEVTLVVEATNTGGTTASEELTFTVVLPTPTPDLTATGEAINAQATTDAVAEANAQATTDAVAEANAQATTDAVAEANAQATTDAVAEANAQATTDAVAEANAQATTDAVAEANAQATTDAVAEANAQATTDAVVEANAQATTDAVAEANAQATTDAVAEANAQATVNAQSTLDAEANTANIQATNDAQATIDAERVQATRDVVATDNAATVQAAQATTNAQSTLDAQATSDADAVAVAQAVNEQSTLDAQATTDAQATIDALATLDTQATLDIEATNNALGDAPTLTPVEIVEVGAQTAENPPAEGNLTTLLCIVGAVIGAIVLIIILWFGRGRNPDETAQ